MKIVDFGVSFTITDGLDENKTTLGSMFYMAPKICSEKVYKDKMTDIWNTSITLYRMLTNKFPFEGSSIPEIYNSI